MLVAKNHHIYVDRVEIETLPQTSSEKKFQTVKVDAWLEPGTAKTIDLGDIGKQATARVYAHAEAGGYANVTLTFIEARIFDEPSSPYADAVESAKAILKAIDHGDKSSIRAMAQRISTAFAAGLGRGSGADRSASGNNCRDPGGVTSRSHRRPRGRRDRDRAAGDRGPPHRDGS